MTDKKKVWISAGCVIIGLAVLGGIDASKLRTESFETVKEAEEHVFTVEPTITIDAQEKPVTRQIEVSAKQMPIRKPTQRPYPDFDLKNLSIIGQEGQINDSSRVESIGESAEDNGGGEGSESVDEIADESGIRTDTGDDADSGYAVEMEGSADDELDSLDGGSDNDECAGSAVSELVESGTDGGVDNTRESPEEKAGGDPESVWSEEGGLTYLGDWTVTAYCPCEICCGEWATSCTASGVMATPNHTVACGSLPFGTQVMIDGNIYTVEDTGVEGEWIDIFFSSHEEASAYGMQIKEVYLVE